jgi:hypothetical protein
MSELDVLFSDSLSGVPMRRRAPAAKDAPVPQAPGVAELVRATTAAQELMAVSAAERDNRLTVLISDLVQALGREAPGPKQRAAPTAFDLVRNIRGELVRIVPVYGPD